MTKLILEFNTGIKKRGKDNRTSLYFAAERDGWAEVTKLLLEDNAGIKERDKNNQANVNHSAGQHRSARMAKPNCCADL